MFANFIPSTSFTLCRRSPGQVQVRLRVLRPVSSANSKDIGTWSLAIGALLRLRLIFDNGVRAHPRTGFPFIARHGGDSLGVPTGVTCIVLLAHCGLAFCVFVWKN